MKKKILILAAVLVASPASAGLFHKKSVEPTYTRVWQNKIYVCSPEERDSMAPCQMSQEQLDAITAQGQEIQARQEAERQDRYWYSANGRMDPHNPHLAEIRAGDAALEKAARAGVDFHELRCRGTVSYAINSPSQYAAQQVVDSCF